ncbi:hypothetical protein SAY86_019983 [Trapa natans]|uniref:MLO-like protein n=1 Tax=Trapa natans TaxID=22666 RepID=A0AAN7LP16_TRANT|nr:hypothetical protein SAY86_019983 [Trapa natans]
MAAATGGRSLEETPTWAVAVVCIVLILISVIIEHIIHLVGKWLIKKRKRALYKALEKIKSELMLLGFISLLLTVGQGLITNICISEKVGSTWHPCSNKEFQYQKLHRNYGDTPSDGVGDRRRLLSVYGSDEETFRRVLAAAAGDKCAAKMRRWKAWERETRTAEYELHESLRYIGETSFGRRHLNLWTKKPLLMWMVCFFRHFVKLVSVAKVDYLTLRHGFIMAHLAPQSHPGFDFHKYIKRSLEDDFKVVVGISPLVWLFAVIFLLSTTQGWYSHMWLPFVPFMIMVLVGTKLQSIVTKMGLKIEERGEIVKGVPNAFQFAFFAWTSMGSTMKPTIFNERVVLALRKWHKNARKNVRESRRGTSVTPSSSQPTTPTNHTQLTLWHHHRSTWVDSLQSSPRKSNCDVETVVEPHSPMDQELALADTFMVTIDEYESLEHTQKDTNGNEASACTDHGDIHGGEGNGECPEERVAEPLACMHHVIDVEPVESPYGGLPQG